MWTVKVVFQEAQHGRREIGPKKSIGWWVGCVLFNYLFVLG